MQITHLHQTQAPAASESAQAQSFLINENVSYDLAASGNIAAVSFSLDVRIPSGGAAFDTLYFTVSTPFLSGTFSGFTAIPAGEQDDTFRTYMANGLTSADFSNLNDAGVRNFGFGFISSVDLIETNPGEHTPEQYGVTVDNFRVTITQVPEPSQIALLLTGIAGILLRRKRP